jgi:LDH2 family malate/lactate/ureidoglycolate dehydrogenase
MLVIKIEAFTGTEDFKKEVDTFIGFLKSSRLMPGFDGIRMPGEIEHTLRRRSMQEGVTVDDGTWQQLRETAASVGVSLG